MSKEILAQGAEAVIYKKDNSILKVRKEKSYRHPLLDKKMRKQRTKREVKVLKQLECESFVPKVISNTQDTIEMEFIDGDRLSHVLHSDNYEEAMKQVSQMVAVIHNKHIIHGDLTTSNILVKEGKYFLIDFGLSFQSDKTEDKAVDLHVFHEALESKHFKIGEQAFYLFLAEYQKKADTGIDVIERLKEVALRGRNKNKS